jgi:hypothetical protein
MWSSNCKSVRLATAAVLLCAPAAAGPAWCPGSSSDHANEIPRYEHIFVIIAENHGYAQIIGNPNVPNLNRLAKAYGSATQFYAEVHPSKANYIAMLSGDTFGILAAADDRGCVLHRRVSGACGRYCGRREVDGEAVSDEVNS